MTSLPLCVVRPRLGPTGCRRAFSASSSAAQPAAASTASASSSSSSSSSATATRAAAASAPLEPTTHYRITLRRSAIGLPERSSLVLESLGLKKRLSSVYMRQEPVAAGKILKVKELVAVQNVRRATAEEAVLVRKHWIHRMRAGLKVSALAELERKGGVGLEVNGAHAGTAAAAAAAATASASSSLDGDDVWIDENGFVVDAGRTGKAAPRGYRVVGNAIDGTGEQISVL